MLIEKVSLRFGAGAKADCLVLDKPSVTIFVGPNNSGKSLVLREIADFSSRGATDSILLSELKYKSHSPEEADAIITAAIDPREKHGEYSVPDAVFLNFGKVRAYTTRTEFSRFLSEPNWREGDYARNYLISKTLILDALNRVGLVEPQNRGDLKYPEDTFARLLTNDSRRESLRTTLYEAFGLYLGLDMSEGASIRLRYGNTAPPNERSVEDATLEWMRTARPVDQWSDGMKAFTGMLLVLNAGDPRTVIVDEPEAFLHPPLAYKLGLEMAKTTKENDKQLFVSTHSSHFLMGTIQSGAKVDIVRLTYQNGEATARMLSSESVRAIMQEPLLRSANALSGLFYEGVVVTEADADRAFYQEVNERLLAADAKRGAPNVLFLNANGKDSVNKIIEPLRGLGIPVATILDIDALNPETNFSAILQSCFYPKPYDAITSQRASVWSDLTADDKRPKSNGGIDLLKGEAKEKAENLFDLLDRYGIFVLRNGEVEHWLPDLQVTRSKRWLRNIFEALGSDPDSSGYVRPDKDDVWGFIDKVAAWIKNNNRRGIPM